ncbi:methionyl-tRNA formyltransferase [Bosea sp. BE125]|uniref:methionyl-tRNA formyltransferase n=1 Tax=Bosea sp. BE125 TaxID=2817909 RepID=UPI00285BA85E|nr:methionyl-tRNA formyltransferase [Bosea sp. BE125]
MHEIDSRFIVFHDSLLPRYRGFAPTVAALIVGDTRIGVSAFRPEPGVDTGAIIDQEPLDIAYPATIREVYQQLGGAYANLARRLLAQAERHPLAGVAQVDALATYSLWRDEDDYAIDWTQSSTQIRRFIDAVGWPYLGAKTRYLGEEIRIGQAEPLPDLTFVNRQAGKLWSIGPTRSTAEVVCGDGVLRIAEAKFADGRPVLFTSLRQRLGR